MILSGFKRPKKQESLGTNPSIQLAFMDRSDLDGKISPERWDLIEEMLIEFMLEESCNGSNTGISSIGWSRGIKVVNCENGGKFLVEAAKCLGELGAAARLKVIPQSDLPLRQIVAI